MGLPSVHLLLAALRYPGVEVEVGMGRSLSQRKHSLFRGARTTHAWVHAAWLAEREREDSSMEVGHSSSDLGNQLHLKHPQRFERLRRPSLGLCWRSVGGHCLTFGLQKKREDGSDPLGC